MWLNIAIFWAMMVPSTFADDFIANPPQPWIIYTIYVHLGLVAVLYIAIIVLVIYYHRMVNSTINKRNEDNSDYNELNEKCNNMNMKTHELYKREKGVDNHYGVNRKNFIKVYSFLKFKLQNNNTL